MCRFHARVVILEDSPRVLILDGAFPGFPPHELQRAGEGLGFEQVVEVLADLDVAMAVFSAVTVSWAWRLAVVFADLIRPGAQDDFAAGGSDRYLPLLTKPLTRRLRVDADAARAFKDALNDPMAIREDSPIFAGSWDPIADVQVDLRPLQRSTSSP